MAAALRFRDGKHYRLVAWCIMPNHIHVVARLLSGADLATAGNGVYAFQQNGSALTGTVEGASVNFTGGMDVPAPIVNGKISGSAIEFKVGNNSFSGNIKGDRIGLERSVNLGSARHKPAEKAPDAPDIGPAPDGSDQSIGDWHIPTSIPVVLRRAER
jgi:hypothetical protein